MNVLLIIILVLWSIVVVKNTLFWVYLWQVKEYRRDRMRAHFELPSSRALLINKRSGSLAALLALSLIPLGIIRALIGPFILIFWGFFAFRATEQFQNRALKIPKRTAKAAALLIVSISIYAAASVAVYMFANSWMLRWLLVGDLAAPVIVSLSVTVLVPPSRVLKKRMMDKAAKKRARMKNLLVIGITGSYGKSSVKEFLYTILSEDFKVLKTEGNINSEIGVARTILDKLSANHDVFIAEMGAYKRGEIARSAQIAQPQMGILTGINQQHVSLFGSLQNIQAAKYELIQALPERGLAFFNGDNDYARALYRQCKKPKRLYTTDSLTEPVENEIRVDKIKMTSDGMEITVKDGRKTETLETRLLGRHNAANLLAAVSIARELGMEYSEIRSGVKRIKAPAHTLQILRGIKESTVIDDTYSANVAGVLAALDTIKRMRGEQKICVLQPLIELGATAKRAHKEIGARIAESCDWCIVTSNDYFPQIYREALDAGMAKDTIFCIPNVRQALRKAQQLTDENDIILLENRIPQELIDGLIIRRES